MSPEEYALRTLPELVRQNFDVDSTKSGMEAAKLSPALRTEILTRLSVTEPQQGDQILNTEPLNLMALDDYTSQIDINPGDLVEYWPDRGPRSTLIILTLPSLVTHKRYITLNERGSIDFTNPGRYRFIVPNFAPDMHIDPTQVILQTDVRLTPHRFMIRRFKQETEELRASHARELARVYESMKRIKKKKKDPESGDNLVSVADAAQMLFGATEPKHLYVAFVALHIDRLHFAPDRTTKVTVPIYRMRTEQEVDDIKSVTSWTEQKSTEFTSFISRAQRIAKFHERMKLLPEQSLEPILVDEEFSQIDQAFIRFMINACLERKDNNETEIYSISIATIVKHLQFFPEQDADRWRAYESLKKIGVLSPWDSLQRHENSLQLPGYNHYETPEHSKALAPKVLHQCALEDLSRMDLRDRCDNIRHDFGDLPVYVIDSDSAAELDDGISVDGLWIHVHIADPSSYITPTSSIGQYARQQVETTYFPDEHFPMLPEALTRRHFSLNSTGPIPTMTTSILLDESGNITQKKVRAGVIRNVRLTTYSRVDAEVFNFDEKQLDSHTISSNYSEDAPSRITRMLSTLTESDKKNIRSIQALLRPSLKYRILHGFLELGRYQKTISLRPSAPPGKITNLLRPMFHSTKLGISLTNSSDRHSPARALVTEAAILANRATVAFTFENKIPIIYRSSRLMLTDKEKEQLLRARDSMGWVDPLTLVPYRDRIDAAIMTLQPECAELLGLPEGYTNATSPLRRYTDMVAQWQVQSHLLGEPYKLNIPSILPSLLRKTKAIKAAEKADSRHWVALMLQQKLDQGDHLDLRATVLNNNPRINNPSEAEFEGIDVRCLIKRKVSDPVMTLGQTYPVTIEEIDLMDSVIYVRRKDI